MKKITELHVATANKCNNNCIFCLDRRNDFLICNEIESPLVPTTDENEFKKILINKLDKVNSLVFTSGEPTINKNLKNLVKIANDLGYKEIIIVTNGRLLSSKTYCEELLRNGVSQFNISIHGHNAEIHELLTRRKGSFNQTNKGLLNLSEIKNKYNFKINTISVITKINYVFINELCHFLTSFKIDSIQLNPVIPVGNALDFFEIVVPKFSDIANEIKKLKLEFIKLPIVIQHMPICLMPEYKDRYIITESHLQGKDEEFLTRFEKIKRSACEKCIYFNECEGVWKEYIFKFGWDEFNPVLRELYKKKKRNVSSTKSNEYSHYNRSLLIRQLRKYIRNDDSQHLLNWNGFYIKKIKPLNTKQILLFLKKGKEEITLLIEDKRYAINYFRLTNKFAISYTQDSPLNSIEKVNAINSFIEYIRSQEQKDS